MSKSATEQGLLVQEERRMVPQVINPTPMSMLNLAVQRGATMEELKMLLDLRKELETDEARKAFNKAFSAFKAESIQIVKNITISDGPLKGKKYANLFAAVDAVTPAMSKHGLSHSWKLTKDEPAWLEVTCTLRHELGHFETVSMGGPPDAGGAKSAIQARASSKSYLERYTLLAITGLASSEGDTDGVVLTSQMQDFLAIIKGSQTPAGLQEAFVEAYRHAGDSKEKAVYIDARDARRAELR